MTEIIFILPSGEERTCAGREGLSVMEIALQNSVPGIIAECNGAAACATCHVVIDPATADMLEPISEHENDMLDFTTSVRRPTSRLSCQIKFDVRLFGARVEIPAEV